MSRKQPLTVDLNFLPFAYTPFPHIQRSSQSRAMALPVTVGSAPLKAIIVGFLALLVTVFGAPILDASAMTALDGEEKEDTVTAMPPGPLELRALDYIRFREDVAEIEAMTFDTAQTTREAHKRLAGHDSARLSSGWMAYAALIAADTPAFSDALKAEVGGDKPKKKKRRRRKKGPAELTGRHAFIAKLSSQPRYPRTMPGADQAIAAIIAMTNKDHLRITTLGENFKSQAYAMQKTRWGKKRINSSSERLSEAEYYSQSRPGMAMPQLAKLTLDGVNTPGIMSTTDYSWKTDWGYPSSRSTISAAGSDAVIDRILNLAARYAVDSLNERVVETYASNKKSEQCLSLRKLTLDQCIAATRTPYEEAFCLGEHAINDVATCIGWVAGHTR